MRCGSAWVETSQPQPAPNPGTAQAARTQASDPHRDATGASTEWAPVTPSLSSAQDRRAGAVEAGHEVLQRSLWRSLARWVHYLGKPVVVSGPEINVRREAMSSASAPGRSR